MLHLRDSKTPCQASRAWLLPGLALDRRCCPTNCSLKLDTSLHTHLIGVCKISCVCTRLKRVGLSHTYLGAQITLRVDDICCSTLINNNKITPSKCVCQYIFKCVCQTALNHCHYALLVELFQQTGPRTGHPIYVPGRYLYKPERRPKY